MFPGTERDRAVPSNGHSVSLGCTRVRKRCPVQSANLQVKLAFFVAQNAFELILERMALKDIGRVLDLLWYITTKEETRDNIPLVLNAVSQTLQVSSVFFCTVAFTAAYLCVVNSSRP